VRLGGPCLFWDMIQTSRATVMVIMLYPGIALFCVVCGSWVSVVVSVSSSSSCSG